MRVQQAWLFITQFQHAVWDLIRKQAMLSMHICEFMGARIYAWLMRQLCQRWYQETLTRQPSWLPKKPLQKFWRRMDKRFFDYLATKRQSQNASWSACIISKPWFSTAGWLLPMASVVTLRTKYHSFGTEIILLSNAKHRQTMPKRLWMLPQSIQASFTQNYQRWRWHESKDNKFF